MEDFDLHFRIRPLLALDGPLFLNLIERNRTALENYFPHTLKEVFSEKSATIYVRERLAWERKGDGMIRIVEEKSTGQIIAFAQVRMADVRVPKGEMAYFADSLFSGRGVVTRLVRQLVAEAFSTADYHKLFLFADEDNLASRRVAEKVGFRPEGFLREDYRTGTGKLINTVYYGLLQSDWKKGG